jgi:hypothetical protein
MPSYGSLTPSTPGQVGDPTGWMSPQSDVLTDSRGLKYVMLNGQPYYLKPDTYGGTHSGGVFHNPDQWNPQTGTWSSGGLNWGAVLPISAGIAMGAYTGLSAFPSIGAGGVGDTAGDVWAGGAESIAPTSVIPAAATTAVTAGGPDVAKNWLTGFNWVAPTVDTSGNIISAVIQANAAGNASELNAKAVADALAFEKQKYGELISNVQPYISSGQSANSRMAQLLGLPSAPRGRVGPSGSGYSGWSNVTSPSGAQFVTPGTNGMPTGGTMAPNTGGSGGQVTLVAPDGSKHQFDARDPRIRHYVGMGAQMLS